VIYLLKVYALVACVVFSVAASLILFLGVFKASKLFVSGLKSHVRAFCNAHPSVTISRELAYFANLTHRGWSHRAGARHR
jgi:hypothetical protein